MIVRFQKNPPAAKLDRLTCVRDDGTSTSGDMPRQGILPHDAFHFVVEHTLGWREAFFGQVAHGVSLDHITSKLHGIKVDWSKNAQALQAESLVECLQAEQWGGAADPETFRETLAVSCKRRHVPAPVLSAEDLVKVKAALRAFGAEWRALNPGQALEKKF
jgi:hypothetical protein